MEYPPCSIGNTSSIRVHFPASYVSLRECFFCVSTRPRLAMRFWNTCKIFSRDPKRACESCHWKKKTHQHWKFCAGDLSETKWNVHKYTESPTKGDFVGLWLHSSTFHLVSLGYPDIPPKIHNIPKRFITILKVPKRSSSSCRNQVRVELIPSSLWCCLLIMSDHHHKKKNPPCCIVWISLLDMCHIVIVSAHISVVTNQCTSHWKTSFIK